MIDGKTKVCGIMANPVEHSYSPMMQNFFGEETGVNFAYVPSEGGAGHGGGGGEGRLRHEPGGSET